MLAARDSVAPAPLPNLFPASARRTRFAQASPHEAVRLASEVLVRALNAMAIDPATRLTDPRLKRDRRFSIALGVAGPLSLLGRPARPERFVEDERRVRNASLAWGAAGPAGRALEAARLIVCAAQAATQGATAAFAGSAVDVAIEAEVLAATLQGRSASDARAVAERRALDICNACRRA